MTMTSETSEIATLCSKQGQRHICSVLTCSKKHFILWLFYDNVCLPIVVQIYTGYILQEWPNLFYVWAAYRNTNVTKGCSIKI